MSKAKKLAPHEGIEKPSSRDIEGVIESILHCTMPVGADPQQHARAAGFARGYWGAKKYAPEQLAPAEFEKQGSRKRGDIDGAAMTRAHDTGYRVGRWLRSLAAKEGR